MSITPDDVKNAFVVQGANPDTLEYVRYATNTLQPIILIVSNSSTVFDIQFFPTSSEAGLVFRTEAGVTVDSLSPVTLRRISGSNVNGIQLSVMVDTFGFDTTPLTSKAYDVSFNLVALTSSVQTSNSPGGNPPTGGNSPVGGGARPTTDDTSPPDRGRVPLSGTGNGVNNE